MPKTHAAFYLGGKGPALLNTIMSTATTKFHRWHQVNRLTLNLTKSKTMLFSRLKGASVRPFMNSINIRPGRVGIGT